MFYRAKLSKDIAKNIRVVQLDVTDQASVDAAFKKVQSEQTRLDVLVNNAGVNVELRGANATTLTVETAQKTFDVNFFGVIRVTTAFIPLLKASSNPVIANISSGLGSHALLSDKTSSWYPYNSVAAYNSSKSALNMYTIAIAASVP